jgi:hypothetical protein
MVRLLLIGSGDSGCRRTRSIMDDFDVGVSHFGQVQVFHISNYCLEHSMSVSPLIADDGKADCAPLPFILSIDLRDGEIEFAPNPTQNTSYDLPLRFQRRGVVNH